MNCLYICCRFRCWCWLDNVSWYLSSRWAHEDLLNEWAEAAEECNSLIYGKSGTWCLIQWNLFSETITIRAQPFLKNHVFLAEGPTFQCNWACHQRSPALRDHKWGGLSRQVLLYTCACLWLANTSLRYNLEGKQRDYSQEMVVITTCYVHQLVLMSPALHLSLHRPY